MVCCARVGLIRPPFASIGDWLASVSSKRVECKYRTSFFFARRLVNNGTMLQTAQVKHAHAAVLPAAHEYVNALSTETNVVDFFVVSNQLRLCRERWYIPDGTRGIDTRSDNKAGGDGIPVQGRQWGCVIGGL